MRSKVKNIFLQYSLVWLIAAIIGCYFRLFPVLNFTTGDTTDKATLYVINYLKTKITDQVNQSFPDLSPVQKEIIIKKQFDDLVHKEKSNVRSSIDQVSKNIQQRSPVERTTPYLLESDPFYYYQLTENIVDHGKISDTFKGSKYLNKLMLAPQGHWEPLNLNPYIGFFIYKIVKIFNPDISLMYAVSFTPLIITILAIIPFLFICYSLHCPPVVSLIGSVYFLLSPIFIKRSTLGWFDNDPYNTFFPLTVLAIIFFALNSKSQRQTRRWAMACALCIQLYAFFWQGWVLLFSIILISGVLIVLHDYFLIKNKAKASQGILFFGIFSLFSFFLLSLTFGPRDFFILFKEGWIALTNFLTPQLSPWPDLYITVGELHRISFPTMIELIGGPVFFGIGLWGIVCTTYQSNKHKEGSFQAITLTTFFGITLFLTLGAQRFAMLFLIPLSLTFCLGIKNLYEIIQNMISKRLQKKIILNKVFRYLTILVFLSLMIIPISYLHRSIREVLNPIFNETWEKALVQIKEKTPPESIINAWWPPGHFIKAIAHRRVTFDGATINFPQAYWMANVFLTEDEKESLGILRMLNTSANQAADYLHKNLGLKLSSTVAILEDIVKLDKRPARIYLRNTLQEDQIDHLLSLTHAQPPPSYLLIFNEFIDSNLQLKFIGRWNFRAIEKINEDPDLFKKVPPRNSKEYIQFLWDLVGGPYQFSPKMAQVSQIGPLVILEQDFSLNLATMDLYRTGPNNQKMFPKSIFYLKEDQVLEKEFPLNNIPYSAIVFIDSGKYNVILLDHALAKSTLIQLYFFNGKGLNYFKPFTEESDLTGRTKIKIFEVDWEKFLKDSEGK